MVLATSWIPLIKCWPIAYSMKRLRSRLCTADNYTTMLYHRFYGSPKLLNAFRLGGLRYSNIFVPWNQMEYKILAMSIFGFNIKNSLADKSEAFVTREGIYKRAEYWRRRIFPSHSSTPFFPLQLRLESLQPISFKYRSCASLLLSPCLPSACSLRSCPFLSSLV